MRIGQTAFIVFFSKIVASAIGFVTTIYFARVLGAEVLGQYALILSLTVWLILGGTLGVSAAISKRISEENDPHAHFFAGVVLISGLGFMFALLVLISRSYIDQYVGTTAAYFVVMLLAVGLFRAFTRSSLKGFRLVHIAGLLKALNLGLVSLLQAVLVYNGLGLSGMIFGYLVGGLATGFLGLWYLPVQFAIPRRHHFHSLIDYAKYSWLSSLESRSFNDVDVVILGLFVPSALIGVYSIAWSISKFLDLFGNAISSTLYPEISNVSAQKGKQAAASLVADSLTYAGLILIPGLVGGTLLADRLLRIYGPEFVQGATVLALLIASLLLYGYQKQLINAMNALNRPDLGFKLSIVFIGTNVLLNFVLIWQFGMVGAAIATLTSAGVGAVLSYWMLSKVISFQFPWNAVANQAAAAAVMGGVVFAGIWIEDSYDLLQHNFATTAGLICLGAGVYFSILLLISPSFRVTIRNNLPSRVSRIP